MLSLFKILISVLICILSTTNLYAEETNSDLVSAHGVFILNTLLFLIGGFLVMWMAAGFAMLEAGLVRSKNVTTQLTKNIALFSIAAIAYFLVGFNLMYPGDLNEGSWWISGYLGPILSIAELQPVGLEGVEDPGGYSTGSDFFFQLMFCATTASIVSGTIAERMKLWPFFNFYCFIDSIFIPN
jgi:Amt family ammonium transporter